MRYLATVTTYTPDGRTIMAGEEYDFPQVAENVPDTLSEMATQDAERKQEMLAHLHGEAPVVKRGPGRPRKIQL